MNPNSHQRTTPKPQAGWGRDGLAPPPRISLRPLFDSHRRSYSAERAPGTSDFPSVAVVLAARGGEPPDPISGLHRGRTGIRARPRAAGGAASGPARLQDPARNPSQTEVDRPVGHQPAGPSRVQDARLD